MASTALGKRFDRTASAEALLRLAGKRDDGHYKRQELEANLQGAAAHLLPPAAGESK